MTKRIPLLRDLAGSPSGTLSKGHINHELQWSIIQSNNFIPKHVTLDMSDGRSTSPNSASSTVVRRRRKGGTCLNCRRRKIRCDGIRPLCGPCTSGSTLFEDCEFPGENPTASQLLEQRIFQVKDRIRALEDPEDGPGITLHHPYVSEELLSSHLRHRRSRSSGSSSDSAGPGLQETPPPGTLRRDSSGREAFQEPSIDERHELLDPFFSGSYQFGFFLDLGRLYQSLMLPHPLGHYARPAPALICTTYLWASHLSSTPTHFEEIWTKNALRYLSRDLSSAHPHRVLHSIQAEVLLSYYYLTNGKMLEGNHHADAALSIALATNLHRIRSPTNSNSVLPPSADAIEENERIDAFWAVLVLNNYWAVIQESHSAYFAVQNGAVDTPWPTESIQHEYHLLPLQSRSTIEDFLSGRNLAGFSEKALHAKATILFERANSIHIGDEPSILQSGAFSHLDSLIDAFQSSLPLVDRVEASIPARNRRVVTQMLSHAAMIKLHLPFLRESESSHRKAVSSAQAIANLASIISSDSRQLHVDPIIGIILTAACDVLMPLATNTDSRIAGNHDLVISLGAIIAQLKRFSEQNPLFKFLMLRFKTTYPAGASLASTSGYSSI